jgi:hypothetical protein
MNNDLNQSMKTNSYIRVRTDFEGYHCYPGAGQIDDRIKFLEHPHRHLFKVEVTISVSDDNRQLEFFLVKWALNDFIGSQKNFENQSCEMMARRILVDFLIPSFGSQRSYTVTVSEDGENDGIIEYTPSLDE